MPELAIGAGIYRTRLKSTGGIDARHEMELLGPARRSQRDGHRCAFTRFRTAERHGFRPFANRLSADRNAFRC